MTTDKAPQLKKLYDVKLSARYLVCGDYQRLSKHIQFMTPLRQCLDKFMGRVQAILPKRPSDNRQINEAWAEVCKGFYTAEGGYFLDVHWYKSALFVGAATLNGEDVFLKVYKDPSDIAHLKRQCDFAHDYFSSHFSLTNVLKTGTNYICYNLIDRGQDPLSYKELYQAAFDMSLHIFKNTTERTKRMETLMPLDLPLLFEKDGRMDLWRAIYNYIHAYALENSDGLVRIVPVHGDMATWNCLRDQRGAITLLDYERSGWHVPFYDMFHLVSHTAAVSGQAVYPDALMEEIAETAEVDIHVVRKWYFFYLLDQLHYGMTDYFTEGYTYPRLARGIHCKCQLLAAVLRRLKLAEKELYAA